MISDARFCRRFSEGSAHGPYNWTIAEPPNIGQHQSRKTVETGRENLDFFGDCLRLRGQLASSESRKYDQGPIAPSHSDPMKMTDPMMTSDKKNRAVVSAGSSGLEVELERFETAWRSGSPPDIEQFFSHASGSGDLSDEQRGFLAELVAIDLERRWRATTVRSSQPVTTNELPSRQVSDKPRLEEYLRRFPALADGEQLLIDLVGHEYRARVLWGDAPDVSEYLRRFAPHSDAVQRELARLDREMSECGFSRVQAASKTDPANPFAPTVDSDKDPIAGDDGPVPARIGRFVVIDVLGSGGFGVVYRALDPDLQREVAVKVPHPESIRARGGTAAYLAEARTIAKLDHPGIVPVYEAGCTDEGQCYVVTKLMAGANLAELIATRRPSIERSASWVARIAEALHHAHARGVIHRDIKPANILMDADGYPLIVDFGLAMCDEDFGSGAGFVGTLSYMSPEQARRGGHLVDARTDIFSLGLVLFELLTGKSPYRGKSKDALVEEISNCDPRPVRQVDAEVPQELDRICQKARAKEPAGRYATAQDFANDLRAFLRQRAKGTVPRWAVPVAVASLAVLAVVAVGGYWRSADSNGSNQAPVTAPAPAAPVAVSAPDLVMDHVVREDDIGRLQEVTEADMPLPNRDLVAWEIHMPRGEQGYLYLFQYDEGHAPIRLWPPAETDLARQTKVKQLRYPRETPYVELSSQSGRTMIVAGVSSTALGPSELAEIESVALSFDDELSNKPFCRVVFPPEEQRPALRSVVSQPPTVQLDPVRLRSSPLRELQNHFDAFRAVVFSSSSSESN